MCRVEEADRTKIGQAKWCGPKGKVVEDFLELNSVFSQAGGRNILREEIPSTNLLERDTFIYVILILLQKLLTSIFNSKNAQQETRCN